MMAALKTSSVKSIERLVQEESLDLKHINIDGTNTLAKKGGALVAYQQRKRVRTSTVIPVVEAIGFVLATTDILRGNHNDAYQLMNNLQSTFQFIKACGINIHGNYLIGDKAFVTRGYRKTFFNYGVIPNTAENKRNRKTATRGRKRLFNKAI